jgi:serine/threonine-protein kinase HipA
MTSPVDVVKVDVYRCTERIGEIERIKDGSIFRYTPELTGREGGIAFQLPYREREFVTQGVNLHPFFANLLPEGLRFQALVRKTKTSADDLLSLLIAVGNDTVGDVRISARSGSSRDASVELKSLDTIDFSKLRDDLLRGSVPEEGVAGVQAKISASRILTSIRGGSKGAEYLLKLSDPSSPHLIENEHACMELARRCDIIAAKTRVVQDAKGVSALLVARFDRLTRGGEVHFEDLCQISNRYPADKYRISVEDALERLGKVCTATRASSLEFLRIYAFSYIIGNGDLHAKNIGVLGAPDAEFVRPSPAYDLLTTLAYKDLDQKRAMPFEDKRGNLYRRDVMRMAKIADIPSNAVDKMLDRLTTKVTAQIHRFGDIGFTASLSGSIKREILRRAIRLGTG